mmetsp:Transcript_16932/g.49557  ORF Transcript_16932/g.49557 Transcript_16932/m.49557 type:complete len:203 (-) Transcript_16932:287-895(-)
MPRAAVASSNSSGSARSRGVACSSARPWRLTATSTTSRSSRSSGFASLRAVPRWETAASTSSRSPRNLASANSRARPCCFTAVMTISRSPKSSGRARRSDRPFLDTAASANARSACSFTASYSISLPRQGSGATPCSCRLRSFARSRINLRSKGAGLPLAISRMPWGCCPNCTIFWSPWCPVVEQLRCFRPLSTSLALASAA